MKLKLLADPDLSKYRLEDIVTLGEVCEAIVSSPHCFPQERRDYTKLKKCVDRELSKRNQPGGSMGKRGFGSMTKERRAEIASMGGKAAHQKGNAHEYTTEEAKAAGKKGGAKVSKDRAHMSAIGKKGGSRGKKS